MSDNTKAEVGEWGKFVRENFDKFLLVIIFLCSVGLVMHITHDTRDNELVLWAREITGTVLGALLGLITGHALAASSRVVTTANPPTTNTVTEVK